MEINLLPWRQLQARRNRYHSILIIISSLVVNLLLLGVWDFVKAERLAKVIQQNNLLQNSLQALPHLSTHALLIEQLARGVLNYRYNMQQIIAAIAQSPMHGTCFEEINLQAHRYQFHGQAVSLSALDKLVRTWPAVAFFSAVELQAMKLSSDGAAYFILQAKEKNSAVLDDEHV